MDVRKTAEHLSPIVKAMLRVQIATGMRPSEVCNMRPADIDRSGETWLYRPEHHKTAYTGEEKAVPLVGDAREAVQDYLNRPRSKPLFSPKESMAWMRAIATANRKTPMSCGNKVGSNRVRKPRKEPGDQYTASSYRRAIQTAAKKAGVDKWHPYQLRHLTATAVREALGIECTQALLGHSDTLMTEHYARESVNRAIEAAKVAPNL